MTAGAEVVDAIVDALDAQQIALNQYYPELGHGQHELSVLPRPALAAADTQVLVRETIAASPRDAAWPSLAPACMARPGRQRRPRALRRRADERNLFHDPAGQYGLSTPPSSSWPGSWPTPGLLGADSPLVQSYARLLPQH